MSFEQVLAILIVTGIVLIAGYWVLTHFFSEQAIQNRRRRRSNRRIASNAKRPTVKFSVRTGKKD